MRKCRVQLCDVNSGYGALRCNNSTSNGCPGSNNGYCYPYNVWSGTYQTAGSNYYNGQLNGGTFYATKDYYNAYTFAFGVRCVLDLKTIPPQSITPPQLQGLSSLNPEMERILVEGTVKEAVRCMFGFNVSPPCRGRVPETKTLGMKGFLEG